MARLSTSTKSTRKSTRNAPSEDEFALRVRKIWQKAVESIIETGKILIEAKATLPHGRWLPFVKERCPFEKSTAEALMEIADHPILSNAQFIGNLPPSWGTLYELTQIPDDELVELIENGKINPGTTRNEVKALRFKRIQEVPNALTTLLEIAKRYPDVEDLEHHIGVTGEWRDLVQFNRRRMRRLHEWIEKLSCYLDEQYPDQAHAR